ncbi:MAG: hypothetical protein FWD19_04610 [Defluviitaleaceae bacterium]|nr:hypothetical protein [Defluviitaleaceae bacterium]
MPQTNLEMRVAQKRHLFTLYKLKKQNEGTTIIGLDNEIVETEAEMEQEDVALVIKKINELAR